MAASAVRIVSFERDAETDARSVHDILEMAAPERGTVISKDRLRKALWTALSAQIDMLVDGDIDEMHIFLHRPE